MSVYQFPDAFDAPEIQIWNNEAFDNGESEDPSGMKASLTDLHLDSVNQSFESDWSKENQNPVLMNSSSSVSLKSVASIIKPIRSSKTPGNQSKGSFEAFPGKSKTWKAKQEADQAKKREDRNIEAEIEEIEKEIRRLSATLECLRLEKAEQTARSLTVRGRIVPAKFMEQKVTKIEDTSISSAKPKINRRGVSLGPSEIFSAAKSRQPGKTETITPLQSIQSRRKSCFWKVQDIGEEKASKERGRRMTMSLSPKSRKAASKIQSQKQAATTVGSKRAVKKDEGILSTVQPKNLFKDGEKSVKTAKKPLKSGRVVASRYSQINNNNQTAEKDARKRSLPENDKEEGNRCEKRRASDENGNQKSESSRVKKRWEIPSEVVVYKSDSKDGETPSSVAKIGNELRKIRTLRCIAESPRDSGPAKRVAELVGQKSIFSSDEDASGSVCQSLSFEED